MRFTILAIALALLLIMQAGAVQPNKQGLGSLNWSQNVNSKVHGVTAGTAYGDATNVGQGWAKLNKTGDTLGATTMSGALAFGTNKATGLGNGTAAQDAITFSQLKLLMRDVIVYKDGSSVKALYKNGTIASGTFGTDDTTIIQGALNNGGDVYLMPASPYYTISTMLYYKGDTYFHGAGNSSKLFLKTHVNTSMFRNKNVVSATYIDKNICIEDLCLDGNGLNQKTGEQTFGLWFKNCQNVDIRRVNIYNTQRYALAYENYGFYDTGPCAVFNSHVEGCKFIRNSASLEFSDAVALECENLVFRGNEIQNRHGAGLTTAKWVGVLVDNNYLNVSDCAFNVESWASCSYIEMSNNYVYALSSAFIVGAPAAGMSIHDINIHDNLIAKCTYGISVTGLHAVPYYIRLSGNIIRQSTSEAIYLGYGVRDVVVSETMSNKAVGTTVAQICLMGSNTNTTILSGQLIGGSAGIQFANATNREVTIKGVMISSMTYSGIYSIADVRNASICFNEIKNCGRAQDGAFSSGIDLNTGTGCTIVGNNIYDSYTARKTMTYGIYLHGASSGNTVWMNHIGPMVTGKVKDDGSGNEWFKNQ
jgi:hypothetical protein